MRRELRAGFCICYNFHDINYPKIMLKEGDKAPDFTAADHNGEVIKLSDLKGQRVVLFFYPKDDTPG